MDTGPRAGMESAVGVCSFDLYDLLMHCHPSLRREAIMWQSQFDFAERGI
jgi:hypothetical protein